MPKLTITRTNQWTNRFRKIWVYMDNKLLCKISNGETLTLDVEAGQHTLYAQGDWLSSETITLDFDADTSKQLELGSPVKANSWSRVFSIIYLTILFYIWFFKKEFLRDERFLWVVAGIFFTQQFVAPLFAKQKPALYYLTWGRKKYIYLKEI